MKKQFLFIAALTVTMVIYGKAPLNDRILEFVDGVKGLMDATKVQNTLWLIKEIKNVHAGFYRVNKAGELDPNGKIVKEFTYKGRKQNLKMLMELEAQSEKFQEQDKQEIKTLFHLVKNYFDLVNQLMAPEAQGTHQFMTNLTKEFCQKHDRPDSLLLTWNKGDEVELFRRSCTSFKVFYVFSTDLMNFLADLILSCPKAYNAYKASVQAAAAAKSAQAT